MDIWDIEEIKTENFNAMKGKNLWAITEEADGKYSLHIHTKDSVCPVFQYDDKRKVVARLLQIFDIGPISPQTWPERCCIGEIEYKSADVLPFSITKEPV